MIGLSIVGALVGGGLTSIILSLMHERQVRATQIVRHVASRSSEYVKPRVRRRVAHFALQIMAQLGSSTSAVERRLSLVGSGTVADFRLHQLQGAGAGFIAGALVGVAAVARGYSPLVVVPFAVLGAVAGALWVDSRLTVATKKTNVMLTRQLPDVVELIALAVSAGEPVRPAMERVVRAGSGVLVNQLRLTLIQVHTGASLTQALADLDTRTQNRNVSRFAQSLIVALEQGGGLSQTLQHQAQDARDAARRELLEEGGKAEILMMIPVVFLILPITVVFTIFPALYQLKFG